MPDIKAESNRDTPKRSAKHNHPAPTKTRQPATKRDSARKHITSGKANTGHARASWRSQHKGARNRKPRDRKDTPAPTYSDRTQSATGRNRKAATPLNVQLRDVIYNPLYPRERESWKAGASTTPHAHSTQQQSNTTHDPTARNRKPRNTSTDVTEYDETVRATTWGHLQTWRTRSQTSRHKAGNSSMQQQQPQQQPQQQQQQQRQTEARQQTCSNTTWRNSNNAATMLCKCLSVSTLAKATARKLATCHSLSSVAWKCRQALSQYSCKCLCMQTCNMSVSQYCCFEMQARSC